MTTNTFIFVIGKLVTYDGKSHGMCYFAYDRWLSPLLEGKCTESVEELQKRQSPDDEQMALFKRIYTLPNLTLLRCNLFACLIATEFAYVVAKSSKGAVMPIVALKHRGAYDLVTNDDLQKAFVNGSSKWPKACAQHKALLQKILKCTNTQRIQIASIPASKNLDGDLEFYVNCDKDPLGKVNDTTEGTPEFERMMRIAKQHKDAMLDVVGKGFVPPGTRGKKPIKRNTKLAPAPPPPETPKVENKPKKDNVQPLRVENNTMECGDVGNGNNDMAILMDIIADGFQPFQQQTTKRYVPKPGKQTNQ